MYAFIESGGKQHKVEVGQVVHVENLVGERGTAVDFDRVLLIGGDDDTRVGDPVVEGAVVKGSIVKHGRAVKILTYVYKRRQNSNRKRRGHRQGFTAVRIDSIEAEG